MTKTLFIIPIIVIAIIIILLVTKPLEETFLGSQIEKFTKVNWNEVIERNIVKNTALITLVENQDKFCKVYSPKFFQITNNEYFVKSQMLIKELQFDNSTNTLMLPCDELKGEKSHIHVWYVVEESPRHATKYEYFVTEIGAQPEIPSKSLPEINNQTK